MFDLDKDTLYDAEELGVATGSLESFQDIQSDLDSKKRNNYSYYCSPQFRKWFLSHFPRIVSDPGLFRLAGFLLLHSLHPISGDEDFEIPVPCRLLRSIAMHRSHRVSFDAGDFLSKFKSSGWDLEVSAHNRLAHKVRAIKAQSWPRALVDALAEESNYVGPTWVDLMTGQLVDQATPTLEPSPIPEVEAIRLRLNQVPKQVYDEMRVRLPVAKNVLKGLKLKKSQQVVQASLLRRFMLEPTLYSAVPGTLRLYARSGGWLSLKRELRGALTDHLFKFDLASAQLIIASSLWSFDISEFYREGSVWTYLLHELGSRKDNVKLKADCKTLMYSALYGRSHHMLEQCSFEMGHAKILKTGLFKTILKQRDAALKRIKAGEEFTDAWGRKLNIDMVGHKRTPDLKARSLMAALGQSWELRLLHPVFEYAQREGLEIVALLHDGIYARGDWGPHIAEIQQLVEQESRKHLGAAIRLDCIMPAS